MHDIHAKDKPIFKIKKRLNEKIIYEDNYDKIVTFKTTEGYITLEQYKYNSHTDNLEENWNIILQAEYDNDNPIEIFQYHNNIITLHFKQNLKTNYKYITRINDYDIKSLVPKKYQGVFYKESFTFDENHDLIEYQNEYGDIWIPSMPFLCPYNTPIIKSFLVPCTHLCPMIQNYI